MSEEGGRTGGREEGRERGTDRRDGGREGGKEGGSRVSLGRKVRHFYHEIGCFKARLHARKKWNGSDKKWNGSDKFLRVNDTWRVPVLPVPFKKGSIGDYGPFSEWN